MGIGSFFGHLGVIPGMITAAIEGKSIAEGAKKGLEGGLHLAEATAGIMVGSPQLTEAGINGFAEDVKNDRDLSFNNVVGSSGGSSGGLDLEGLDFGASKFQSKSKAPVVLSTSNAPNTHFDAAPTMKLSDVSSTPLMIAA